MDLSPVAVFVKVVQAGSFNAAARQLDMPNSTVSAQVARLERRLGITLLLRTTRKLNITEAGKTYFQTAVRVMELIQETEERLSACHGEAQGILRVTTTADLLPASSIAQLLKEFRECYPKVSVELDMTQRTVDLLQDGVHVAIRAGPLKDSLLISRKIGAASWRLAASPCYLQTAPELGRPKDLTNHRILHFYTVGRDSWHLRRGRQTVTVSLPQHTAVNRIEVIKSLALIGEGIALMPAYYLRDAFADGTLIHVLPEWSGSTDPISVVYPAQKYLPANVRAFVDFVAERFRGYFDASLSK